MSDRTSRYKMHRDISVTGETSVYMIWMVCYNIISIMGLLRKYHRIVSQEDKIEHIVLGNGLLFIEMKD